MRRAALVLLLMATAARADSTAGTPHSFGIGIIIGSPTGISAKLMLGNPRFGVDAAVGEALIGGSGVQVHADFLYHPVILFNEEDGVFSLPFYFGLGARFLDEERPDKPNDVHLGARIPVGISFVFHNIPLDVFVEAALVLDVLRASDEHFGADLNAGIGVRYWF